MYAGAFGRADDGPEIAHIGDLVQDQDQRRGTPLPYFRENILKAIEVNGRHHGDHPLVVFPGDAVHFLLRNILEGNPEFFDELIELSEEFVAQAVADQHLIDGAPCADGLDDRARAENEVVACASLFHIKSFCYKAISKDSHLGGSAIR